MELTGQIRTYYRIAVIICAIVSLVGYTIFWITIWNRKKLQSKTTWLMSLSFSDSIMAINLILASFVIFEKEWNITEFGSQVYACLSLSSGFVSMGNLAGIAMDKYLQVCKPDRVGVNYGFYFGLVWGLGFFFGALPAFGVGAYEEMTENSVSCVVALDDSRNGVFVILVACIWFAIPVVLMMLYYRELVAESKQFKTFAVSALLIFLIFYTPYAAYAGMKVTVGLGSIPSWLKAAIYLFPKLLIASNPYTYMFLDPEFLQDFKSASPKQSGKKKQ